jgi:hypothetical protein
MMATHKTILAFPLRLTLGKNHNNTTFYACWYLVLSLWPFKVQLIFIALKRVVVAAAAAMKALINSFPNE